MRGFNRKVSHTPSRFTIIVAALATLAVLGGLTMVALVAPRGVPGLKYYELDAQFKDALQIADLSQVRIAGRNAGQVTGSSLKNGHATVRLQLFPGQGPVRSDATARIRLKGLLGAKFVDLTLGHNGRELPNGATLPAKQTSSAVELLGVLQAFDPKTRARLQATLRGLGKGFLGRGPDINQMLSVAPGFYGGTERVSSAILARPGAAARFGPSAESLAAAYDPVRTQLAAGFKPEARVLQAFVDRRSDLQSTLTEAPSSLEGLRQGLTAATPLLIQTEGLAHATIRLTRPAPAALRETSVFLHKATPALRQSRPLLDKLAKAVPSTLRFLHTVDPVTAPAIKALKNNVPGLVELARHGCDVLSFAKNWRSTLGFGVAPGFGDPIGTLDDGEPGLGPVNSLRVVAVRTTELEMLSADAPGPGPNIGRDPYPAPCVATGERLR